MCQNKYFLTTYQLHFQNISTFINNDFPNMIDWTSGNTFTIFQIFPSKTGSMKNPRIHRLILQTTWQLQCETYTSVHWKKRHKTSYIRILQASMIRRHVFTHWIKTMGFGFSEPSLDTIYRKYVLQAIG